MNRLKEFVKKCLKRFPRLIRHIENVYGYLWNKYIFFRSPFIKRNREAIKYAKDAERDFALDRHSFWQFVFHCHRDVSTEAEEYIESYKAKRVKPVRIITSLANSDELVLLCIAKDDIEKVQMQIEYHRKHGVKHFVYVDNASTDGTFEYLLDQDDVSLFSCDEMFNVLRKEVWRKLAIDYMGGGGRWYLILDQDELFCYPGIERIPIPEYVRYLEENGYKCCLAPMIDMYSDNGLFANTEKSIFQEFCWFDTDSYRMWRFRGHFVEVYGGGLSRLSDNRNQQKYPLVYVEPNFIPHPHYVFPRKLTKKLTKPIAYLLHYKHTFSELEKNRDIRQKKAVAYGGRYHEVSVELYESDADYTLMYKGSAKFDTSLDLLKIDIGDKRWFKRFLDKHGVKVDDYSQ